jgi:hypothetical protein
VLREAADVVGDVAEGGHADPFPLRDGSPEVLLVHERLDRLPHVAPKETLESVRLRGEHHLHLGLDGRELGGIQEGEDPRKGPAARSPAVELLDSPPLVGILTLGIKAPDERSGFPGEGLGLRPRRRRSFAALRPLREPLGQRLEVLHPLALDLGARHAIGSLQAVAPLGLDPGGV